jgi:hypothetical protein
MGGNFDVGSSPVMQEVHDAANTLMKAGSVIGALSFATAQPEGAAIAAGAVLLGAGLHGLAYAHEAFIEMAFAP